MSLEKFLIANEELPVLKRFAFVGGVDSFNSKLNYLIGIAEEEPWDQVDKYTTHKNSTIFYYIIHTFDRLFYENKIVIDKNEENSFFNTGLMTPSGSEIYGYFVKNSKLDETGFYWFFKTFLIESDREVLELCPDKPQLASYYDDYRELHFDPNLEILLNFDHIYDDNKDRLPASMQILPKNHAKLIFDAFLENTKKRIKRNNRIPVPQFYNGQIMFLLPINIYDSGIVVLAVEKINNTYRGATILTKGMAYSCARLLNKPESNWLLP